MLAGALATSLLLFHVVLFLCRNLFIVHFFNVKNIENEQKKEVATRKITLHSARSTCFTFILISYKVFYHYIILNG